MSYKSHPDASKRIQSAKDAIKALLQLDLYPAHKRELLSVCLWKLTEAESFHKHNLRYQTPAARAAPPQEKQHEHVFERKKMVIALIAEPARFEEILSDAVGCTITKEEHKRLTELSRVRPELDGWERYQEAGITVLDLVLEESGSMTTCPEVE